MPALLEGHRLDVRISRRGRDDLRVVRKLCSPTSPRQKTWKNWTAHFAPQQADPIPIHWRDAVSGAFSPVRRNASTRSTVPVFKRIPSALLYIPLP